MSRIHADKIIIKQIGKNPVQLVIEFHRKGKEMWRIESDCAPSLENGDTIIIGDIDVSAEVTLL
jgi:hypothetical protein